jgi:hypothetical protein
MAIIVGTNGPDRLIGTAEADLIEGLGGDDELAGGAGNDTLDGGAGFDWIALWRDNPTIGARIDFGAGRIVGDPVNTGEDSFRNIEQIIGTRLSDFFDASTFGLVAGNGNYGSAGLFNIFMPLRGSDVILGNGSTTLFLNDSGATAGVTVDLSKGYAYGAYHGNKVILGGVNGVRGTSFADNIKLGDSANDWFEVVRASLGNDTIDGGTGYDRVEYNRYNVSTTGLSINMGAGTVSGKADGSTDLLRNIEGIRGTSFNDVYDARGYSLTSANAAGAGKFLKLLNDFDGGAGNDIIFGNGQTTLRNDLASGGVYVDLVTGTSRGLDGGNSANVGVNTFSGVIGVFGSRFNDLLIGGNSQNDRFEHYRAGGGNDTIDGGSGWDMARYDDGLNGAISNTKVLFTVDVNGNKLFTDSVTVNLAQGLVLGGNTFGTDTLRGIEAIRGSLNNDVFNATGFSGSSVNAGAFGTLNEFEGLYGNDQIIGNGNTRVSFKDAYAGVTVDIAKGQSYSSQYLVDGSDPALVGVDNFSGVNAVAGSYYSDVFVGTAAKEYFFGADGNDTIRGDGGKDVAIYQGKSNEYVVAPGVDALGNAIRIVSDTQSGRDGIDQLYGISRLQFSDTGLALDTGLDDTAAEAYRIYKAAFNRAPDASGLGYWIEQMDNGTKLLDVANAFIGSKEFMDKNGTNLSDVDFINAMYLNVLGRGADADGFNYWLGVMGNGLSRAAVLTEFSESGENVANVASLISGGIQYTPLNPYPTEGLYM